MEEINRQFKGVWIPKEIWLSKDLTPLEKMYLVEFDSLDNGETGCYASNKHFEIMFNQTSSNVSRMVTNLKEKGWINVIYERQGKEITKRIIKVNRPPYPDRYYQNDSTYYQNDNRGTIKMITGYYQNDKESITLENNILDNIEKDNNKLLSKKKFIKPTLDEIKEYCIERNNTINAEQFFNYYESNGWKVGRNAMKDWKACVRTWESKETKKVVKTSNPFLNLMMEEQNGRQ